MPLLEPCGACFPNFPSVRFSHGIFQDPLAMLYKPIAGDCGAGNMARSVGGLFCKHADLRAGHRGMGAISVPPAHKQVETWGCLAS